MLACALFPSDDVPLEVRLIRSDMRILSFHASHVALTCRDPIKWPLYSKQSHRQSELSMHVKYESELCKRAQITWSKVRQVQTPLTAA